MIFLGTALTGVALASTTFTPIGWISATVNGTKYNAGVNALPNSVSYQTANGSQVITSCTSGSGRLANQHGTITNTVSAQFDVAYQVTTSTSLAGYSYVKITGSKIGSGSANADVYANLCSANGTGIGALGAAVTASQVGPGEAEPPGKTKTQPWTFYVPTSVFSTAGGSSNTTVGFSLPAMGAGTGAINGLSSTGRFAVCQSGAGGSSSAILTGLTPSNGPIFPATTQSFVTDLQVHVIGNGVDETYLTTSKNGSFLMGLEYAPGTYDVYISAQGSLRRKLSATVNAGGTVTCPTDFSLKFGDLDGDNTVSSDEVNYIHSMIGYDIASQGMAEFNADGTMGTTVNGHLLYAYQADLDGDGKITTADYNIALANQGLSGD